MYQVVKRDGKVVDFDIKKIAQAIQKAFDATNTGYNDSTIDFIALRVTSDFESKIKDGKISVEDIQDSVESVLSKGGYDAVSKAYILYRVNREKLRNTKNTFLDYKDTVDKYLKISDWRVKENSTVTYSVGGLILSNSGAITANYWLSEVYDQEIADAHRNCDMHIHDLSMLTGYCAGWNLKQLIQEGLGGVPGKITSAPAGHLSTLCNQMVNFLGILQNEWAGAQAFSSFDTYLAPFVKVDNLSYKEVKQGIQSFIYGVNTPSRWGTQAPFSNVTLDWTCPKDIASLPAIVGGKEMNFTYGDCQKEMDMVNKAFIELMIEGDANGRGFQYPIPTYSITKDFDWSETENNRLLFEMTSKYGTPYFSNYINSDMNPEDIRSMCLHPDTVVRYLSNGRPATCTIEYMYDKLDTDSIRIQTRYGYRPVKEKQKFKYQGLLYKFTTESGRTLLSTADHPHIVFVNGLGNLTKIPANAVSVGDYFSSRRESFFATYNKSRAGKTFEDIYGETRAAELRRNKSEMNKASGRWSGENNPAYGGLTEDWRLNISRAQQGHYVSEECRRASRDRWSGDKNPYFHSGGRLDGKSYCYSEYEQPFAEELESLGVEYFYQFMIPGVGIGDFYIPSKNLVVELETDYRWDYCSYNDTSKIFIQDLKDKYDKILDHGYNLLVFNPSIDFVSYRPYINNKDKIVAIETIPYDGYVYDVEIDCDDLDPAKYNIEMAHSFYANDILTGNCCRLRLDLRELRKKGGGFFGSGESTGSIGVVTINMPKIAYESATEDEFYQKLDKVMDIAARSLDVKRKVITQLLDAGLYPYTKRYLGDFHNHFSTIGLVGMNEAGLNAKWIRADMTDVRTQKFAVNVLNHMRDRLSDYQEKYGDLFNLEATPAESTSYRLAKHDKDRYPDIITASEGSGTPYYTNSSHLPVGYTDDVFSALDVQDELQTLYTSGTVFHAFLGEKMPDWKAAANLVRKIAENYRLPYYTISPTYSVCRDHGYLTGEQFKCPICGKDTEVYSRITGYYRPVQNWNDGKSQEYKDRKEYVVAKSHLTHIGPKTEKHVEMTCEDACDIVPEASEDKSKYVLVATATCPNCKTAAKYLNQYNVSFKKILVNENPQYAKDHGVRQAPTLLIFDGDKYDAIAGAGAIKQYIEINFKET